MTELCPWIEASYRQAKEGKWGVLMAAWEQMPFLARRCSRFRNPSSGWTFLHQAAYFGHEAACRELIRLGAAASASSLDDKKPADVAQELGHQPVASLLQRAEQDNDSPWAAPVDPDVLPSSNLWAEAEERRASSSILIAYGGGLVQIAIASRYFVDSLDRTLIGWHGTYDPPLGMDGESLLEKA